MNYCMECGTKLVKQPLKHEGLIPYCPQCKMYRFPIFYSAVSMVILNKEQTKTLLIKQYGSERNILVAGYINHKESAEEAVRREMKEEIGIEPISIEFQKSAYWPKSNALIFNFKVIVDTMELQPNYEIDSYGWYGIEEALACIAKGGLAEDFYKLYYANRMKKDC